MGLHKISRVCRTDYAAAHHDYLSLYHVSTNGYTMTVRNYELISEWRCYNWFVQA